jgi:hypothetical protein
MSATMARAATTVDDATLIRAAQQGDEEAFEKLVHAHDDVCSGSP